MASARSMPRQAHGLHCEAKTFYCSHLRWHGHFPESSNRQKPPSRSREEHRRFVIYNTNMLTLRQFIMAIRLLTHSPTPIGKEAYTYL